jgi:hypothetical protein
MSLVLLLALVLQLPEYRERLAAIDAQLQRGETARAAKAAGELLDAKVMVNGQELSADRWALLPVSRGEPHRARLRALIEGWSNAPETGARGLQPKLLEEIRQQQELALPARGGELTSPDLPQKSLVERLRDWLKRALQWLADRVGDFLDWLFGKDEVKTGKADAAKGSVVWVLGGAVVLILVLVLALALASLRGGRSPALARSPVNPSLDDDPLSRTVAGWETRARELAAEGRAREAIRAWYHALLVRCYAAGLLHYQRGRTNWEYARALGHQVAWRGQFEELTRQFDVEWYGREASTAEALGAFADGAGEILRALGSGR